MKVRGITIYGYGRFEDYRLQDLPDLTVITGPNEAGKSTIMSFIHSILFGFPPKSELRYEPKKHSKYGGMLLLETEHYGKVRIERVKGKAAGDVSVFCSDGTCGGEDLLREILGPIDRDFYQEIFSFNIHGLQNVQRLKGEQLNRFLFSAGAIGSERLLEAEQWLEKEMDRWFKKSGTKPLINQQINRLKELERQVARGKERADEYGNLLKLRDEYDRKLASLREEIRNREEKKEEMQEWNRMHPLLAQKRELQKELDRLEGIRFPLDGRKRLEQIEAEKIAVEKRLAPLRKKKADLEEQLDGFCGWKWLEREDDIEDLAERRYQYIQAKEQMTKIDSEISHLLEEQDQLKFRLDQEGPLDFVDSADFSFAAHEKIRRLTIKRNSLEEKRRVLDERKDHLEQLRKEKSKRILDLRERLLSSERKEQLERILEQEGDRQRLLGEKTGLEEHLNRIRRREKQWLAILLFCAMVFLLAGTALYFLQLPIPALLIVSLAMLLPFAFFITRGEKKPIRKRLQAIDASLKGMEGEGAARDARLVLEQNGNWEKQIEKEQMEIDSLDREWSTILQELDKWETEWRMTIRELASLGREYHLKETMAVHHLDEAFPLLEKLRDVRRDLSRFQMDREAILRQMVETEQRLSEVEKVGRISGHSVEEKLLLLKKQLENERKKRERYRDLQKKLDEVSDEIRELEEEKRQLDELSRKLFAEAGAATKEEFLRLAEQNQIRVKYQEDLRNIDRQLISFSIEPPDSREPLPSLYLEDDFRELENDLEHLRGELEQLERKRAELGQEIRTLEEGGTYPDLLRNFHEEKYHFRESSLRWAALATARYALKKAMEMYKQEKLPPILERASRYFYHLTEGAYRSLYVHRERDELVVEREDGIQFSPAELSQATGEQLYVSIRFALAEELDRNGHYPLLIDDGFVHFDAGRLQRMLALLEELSRNRQILFFTCHEHLARLFRSSHVVTLKGWKEK